MKIQIGHGFYVMNENIVFVGPGFFEFNNETLVGTNFYIIAEKHRFDFTKRNTEWKPGTIQEEQLLNIALAYKKVSQNKIVLI